MRKRSFPDRLHALLLARGWSQRDLANVLRVDESTVSRWMSGEKVPRASTIALLERIEANHAEQGAGDSPPQPASGSGR